MGDATFRTGFAVFRARYPDVVPIRQRRNRTIASGIAAFVVGTLVTITEIVFSWSPVPWPLTALGIVFFAAAVGSVVPVFMRTAPRGEPVDWSFRPTGDWRRVERIRRQFGPNPPAMHPDDRDRVLEAVEQSRDAYVRSAARTMFLPALFFVGWFGVLVTGMAAASPYLFVAPPLFGLLQSSSFIAMINGLGRAELARRRAQSLPELPAEPPRTWPRGPGPSGSKTALPGER